MARNGNGDDNDGSKPPYEVGYGRPPKRGQFKPGRSGNPKGRRKGSKSLEQIVSDVLCEELPIIENGRRSKVMAIEIIIKKVRNSAMSGNKDAYREVIKLTKEYVADNLRKNAAKERAAASYDFSKFTVEELEQLQDAANLLEGKQERPPPPLPPGYRWIDGKAVLLNPRTGEPYDEEGQ